MLSRTEPPPQLGGRDPVASGTPTSLPSTPTNAVKVTPFSSENFTDTLREPRDGLTDCAAEMQRLLSVPSRRKPQTKAKQRKTKRNKPPSRERKVYAPEGRFFTLLRGLSVDFTPTQLLSIKRIFFKSRYILESFNEIHCTGGKPSFLPLFLKVRMRISTQMRQSALL